MASTTEGSGAKIFGSGVYAFHLEACYFVAPPVSVVEGATVKKTDGVDISRLVQSILLSQTFRAVALPLAAIGVIFLATSNPVGWVATTLMVSAVVAKVLLALSVPAGILLMTLSHGIADKFRGRDFLQTWLFEFVTATRKIANHDLINLDGTEPIFKEDANAKLLLGGLPNLFADDQFPVSAVVSLNQEFELEDNFLSFPKDRQDWRHEGIVQTLIPARDHAQLSPEQLDQAADAIHEGMKGKGSYVHCRAGVGRSGAAVAAYIMKYRRDSVTGEYLTFDRICKMITDSRKKSTIAKKKPALEAYQAWLIQKGHRPEKPDVPPVEVPVISA